VDAADDCRVAVDVVRRAEHEHQLPEGAEGGWVERGRHPQLREADPVRAYRWWRRDILTQHGVAQGRQAGGVGGLYQVLAGAAGSDPEIAQLYREQQHARYADQQRLARSLAAKGALKKGLSDSTATDIRWAIANPSTHYALVSERRWTPETYEEWLAHMLTCALLPE
jgi:hypothetical protein